MRFYRTTAAAHSGRAWKGENAIHKLAGALRVPEDYEPQTYEVEGLRTVKGLNAVRVSGESSGERYSRCCRPARYYRFAPNKTLDEEKAHVTELFDGYELDFADLSPAARPGLDTPLAASLIAAVGQEPKPKYGWTDVARAQRDRYSRGEFWSRRCAPRSHRQRVVSFSALPAAIPICFFLAAYRSRRRLADKPCTDANTHFNICASRAGRLD